MEELETLTRMRLYEILKKVLKLERLKTGKLKQKCHPNGLKTVSALKTNTIIRILIKNC